MSSRGARGWCAARVVPSVREKARYALKEKVGGVMIWEITHDVVDGKHLLLEPLTKPLLR